MVTQNKSVITWFGGREKGDKETWRNGSKRWVCSLLWLWGWISWQTVYPKPTNPQTLNMCTLLYVNMNIKKAIFKRWMNLEPIIQSEVSQKEKDKCRKCRAGRSTSWNHDCREKYQSPQIRRWHHPYGRKRRGTKEPLDESERADKKLT